MRGSTRVADGVVDPNVCVVVGPVRYRLIQDEGTALGPGETVQRLLQLLGLGMFGGGLHHFVKGLHYQLMAGLEVIAM